MKYLLVLFSMVVFTTHAESFYTMLRPAQADSLRSQLWRSAPDTNRVKLLIQLSNDILAKHYNLDEPSDTIEAYIRQARELSKVLGYVRGQIDGDYALAYFMSFEGEQARKLVLDALARSQQRHDKEREAMGWYFLTYSCGKSLAQQPQRIQYFERAARLFHANHNPVQEARSLKKIADAHLTLGNPALAREELLRVVALYQACGYRQLHYTFDLLSAVNRTLGNYRDALLYAKAAVQRAKSCQDTTLIRAFYMSIGSVYQEQDQLENTLEYYLLALHSAEQYRDVRNILELAISISRIQIALHQPQQALALLLQKKQAFPPYDDYTRFAVAIGLTSCYSRTKQFALASAYNQQIESFLKSKQFADNYRALQSGYLTAGGYYFTTKQYAKAQPYLAKALALGQQLGYHNSMATTCLLIYKADSAQGDLPAALAHYKRYKAINDSIFSEKNSKQMAGLQIQYDTKQKEQSIALLTKQTQLQSMTIRQRGFQRNAFVIGTALLVLVLGLGYNRYRLGQRSNRLLEEKQQLLQAQQAEISQKNQSLEQVVSEKETLLTEKEWMLKEIHHRVKNNLQVISSLLTNQSNYLRDPLASAAIRESRNRVQAMALIHQRLYQTDTLARVNMAAYVREIVNSLLESFDRFDTVTTQLNVVAVELEIALATPLGLIVNEAVTNVLKYAFPPAGRGTLTIVLTEGSSHHYRLTIMDDGVGLPSDFDLDQSHSLGLTIIKGLSTQIGGGLRIESANGVRVSLQFEAAKSVAPVG
jgi:two-component sensor histidine kinase